MVETGQPLTIFSASSSPGVTSFPAPTMARSETLARQVASSTKGTSAQLLVSVCGRSVNIDLTCADSLDRLQSALQSRLNMEGQLFQFFDSDGAVLTTDAQVQDAVKGSRVPLCATLTDASIHLIQNRREELAQMQWQLIRDQMTGNTGKMAVLERRVNDLEQQVGLEKQEARTSIERAKLEIQRSLEESLATMKSELRIALERTETTSQLISIERNKGEVALEVATDAIHKHINSLRETVDTERAARRQDVAVYSSIIKEAKAQLDDEKLRHKREFDKQEATIQSLGERIDSATGQFATMVAEHDRFFKKSAQEASAEAKQSCSQVNRMRMDAETSIAEAEARFRSVELQCTQLEARISEAGSQQADSIVRLIDRQEQTAQMLEGLRVEERSHQDNLLELKEHLHKLDDTLTVSQDEMRELVSKERRSREENMRRIETVMLQRHSKQISDLESKLTDRLEQKSSQREQQVKEIFDEVIAKHSDAKSRDKASDKSGSITPPPERWPPCQALVISGTGPARSLAASTSLPTPPSTSRAEVSPVRIRHSSSFSTTSMNMSNSSSNLIPTPTGSFVSSCPVSSCQLIAGRQASPESRARSNSLARSTTASTVGSQMTSVVVPAWPRMCESAPITQTACPVSPSVCSVTSVPALCTPQTFTFT